MKVKISYVPTEKQRLFHQCSCDEALYGGAAGGGKSTALVMDAFMRCIRAPGIRAYLFRRTYGELADTLVATARRLIPPSLGKYSAASHELVLKNGSVMRFRHLHCENDKYKYQGAEINALYIDELTHFSASSYDYLKTRLRAAKRLNFTPIVRASANPGGAGHGWVKARFIDEAPPCTEYAERVGEKLHTRIFIPAKVTDNPHINPEYIYELERKPKALRDALLLGDWNTFSGQAFPEWRDDPGAYATGINTHVLSPFPLPSDFVLTRAFDFGYSKPFSVLWLASAPSGRVYLAAEWYGASAPDVGLALTPEEIARGIAKREAELFPGRAINGVADPSIWDKSRGESVAAQMERLGIYFTPGENARLAGKMQLHYRLSFDGGGRPGLYVFSCCREFIRALPALTLDPARPEDVDTRCEDHCYDALRYYLMSVPKAQKKRVFTPAPFDPLSDGKKPSAGGFLSL